MSSAVEQDRRTDDVDHSPSAEGVRQEAPRRRRSIARGGLESPLLSLPAIGTIVIGVFLPMLVLAVYSWWPTVDQEIVPDWTLDNYGRFFDNATYWRTLLRSLAFAGFASAITVAIAFPFAYFVALKVPPRRRLVWVLLAVLPFFSSYLLRVFAWMNLLGDTGLINQSLIRLGLIGEPIGLLGLNTSGIIITFVYLLFPLAFLTIYVSLERSNPAMLEAAADLGAKPWRRLVHISLPIARTAIIGGIVFSAVIILGDYVTPQLIGGTDGYLYANLIQGQFGSSVQWGFGSALALILMVVVFGLLVLLRRASGGAQSVGTFSRTFTPSAAPYLRGYAVLLMGFVYLPVALLVLLSVNASPTVGFPFTGVTFEWFEAVFADPLMLDSLRNSLVIAGTSVAISLVLGTTAAVQLARSGGRWRRFSLGVVALPIFLPPMLLGLAIIIGLNALGVERGLWTIIVGHTILCLPITTLLVLIRLEGLDPNLELAAMDLGATPARALLRVSVPQALPGIVAAALITFALSMDEFILTALVTGADSTLPLYIFGQLRFSVSPAVVALSVMLLAVSFLLLALGAMVATAGQRKSGTAARVPLNLEPSVNTPA